MLGSSNIKLRGLKVHLNTKKIKYTCIEIPINLSFLCVYIYIYYQKKQIFFKFKLKKRKWLKFENWPLKYISELSSIIPISIQVLIIPDLVFPVYKIDREQSEKNVSEKRLKIPKRYSEAVVIENCLKD